MNPEQILSQAFIEAHCDDAAAILERLPPEETAALMAEEPPSLSGRVLSRMALSYATQCIVLLPPEQAGAIVAALPMENAAGLLRPMDSPSRDRLLAYLSVSQSAPLRRLLQYPEGTAGAVMDPQIVTLPEDITVAEAIRRVGESPHHVIYYLYVVNRDQRLVGVLNLRELMLAPRQEHLASVMRSHVETLLATADRLSIIGHAGWREFHALPVVDDVGTFVGVIRYETLRRLEQVKPPGSRPRDLGVLASFLTLGEVYWIGLFRVLGGLVSAVSSRPAVHEANSEDRT